VSDGPESRVAALRTVPLLAEIQPDVIARLAEMARPVDPVAGSLLMREGEDADGLYVVLDGRLEVTKRVGSDDLQVGAVGAGEVVGEMALLERGPRTATVRAVTAARTLFIARDAFVELMAADPGVALAMVQTLARRLRATQAMLEQREKLASLGTLAAGLAHELNNPAAAMRRSASLLREAFAELGRASQALADADLDAAGRSVVDEVRERAIRPSRSPSWSAPSAESLGAAGGLDALGALDASDAAEAIETQLAAADVDDAWRIAPVLADGGWTADDVAGIGERVGAGAIGPVAAWLAAITAIDGLVGEILMTSERISELVTAVKSYTFLDQAPLQEIDIRDGIESTLVIMRHKLRDGVAVVRDYAPDLPRIQAYGSELNQVWTNLVDNAIDAMDGRGTLTIRVRAEPADHVTVDVCDDGPGIPEPVQRRIFEPFYTTKEPGKGTGLGLHISHSIVVGHHGGRLGLTSGPGSTCFHVTLPVALAER
jgi:signal transduction histidine kinase